jgi:hypothetical protein
MIKKHNQKPKTFQEAYDDDIISHNIKITIETLFNSKNLFYLNSKPYTIVSLQSDSSDWNIDSKPTELLKKQFPQLTIEQLKEDAKKEKNKIPEMQKQGSMSSVSDDEHKNVLNELKQKTNIKNELIGPLESFMPTDLTNDTEYLKNVLKNEPFNYTNDPDIIKDPITLSLLVSSKDILNVSSDKKYSNIATSYLSFIKSKEQLKNANKNVVSSYQDILDFKKQFNNSYSDIMSKLTNPINEIEKNEIINQLNKNNSNYVSLFKKFADNINNFYKTINSYFEQTKKTIELIKTNYNIIIKHDDQSFLSMKCIEYDIYIINLLLKKNDTNLFSINYFANYNKFKNFYDNKLPSIVALQNNNIDNYISMPILLEIERIQYNMYDFKLLLFYKNIESDIWLLLFKSIETFIPFMQMETKNILNNAELLSDTLNTNFDEKSQEKFINDADISGLKPVYNKDKVEWKLIKSDGTFVSQINKPYSKVFEDIYIKYLRSLTKSYESIILYIYLLEILCSRNYKIYLCEENINFINLEYSQLLNNYYENIEKLPNINDLPNSFLWNTEELKKNSYLNDRINTNKKAEIVYKNNLYLSNENKNKLTETCKNISDIIKPNNEINSEQFINKCEEIIDQKTHIVSETRLLEQSIKFYDSKLTNDFIENMETIINDAFENGVIHEQLHKYYLNWAVYNTNSDNLIDSLYSSVSFRKKNYLLLPNMLDLRFCSIFIGSLIYY